MCFDQDADWIARVYEETITTAEKPTRCDECGQKIPTGGWLLHVWMQQYEDCLHTFDDDSAPLVEGVEECPPDCKHNFGETYDYDRCESCDKILRAIEDLELKRGCHRNEARPLLTQMRDAVFEEPEYADHAIALFPEVADYVRKFLPEKEE